MASGSLPGACTQDAGTSPLRGHHDPGAWGSAAAAPCYLLLRNLTSDRRCLSRVISFLKFYKYHNQILTSDFSFCVKNWLV